MRLRLGPRLAAQVQPRSMRTRFREANSGQWTCVALSPGARYWQEHAQNTNRSQAGKVEHARRRLRRFPGHRAYVPYLKLVIHSLVF